jgi:hypothetical protein
MGRDIYVESKHFGYYGSKSSDLIMAFDRYFWKFPKYSTGGVGYYNVKLSRKEMKQALEFIKDDTSLNGKLYRNVDELLERINNVYISMTPNDFVKVWTC